MNYNGENERAPSFLDFVQRKTHRPAAHSGPASAVRGESPISVPVDPTPDELLRVISGNQEILSDVIQRVLVGKDGYLPNFTSNRTDFHNAQYRNEYVRKSESPASYTRPSSTQSSFEQYEMRKSTRQDEFSDMEISPEEDNNTEMSHRSPHADSNKSRRDNKRDFRRDYDNHHHSNFNRSALADSHRSFKSFESKNCRSEKRANDNRGDSNYKRNRPAERDYETQKPGWKSQTEKKIDSDSILPWDYISEGDFQSAFKLLNRQVGFINFKVYKRFVYRSMLKSNITFRTTSEFPYVNKHLSIKLGSEADKKVEMDYCGLDYLLDCGFRLATAAKFDQAIEKFREVLSWIPLTIVHNSNDEIKVTQAVKTCQTYIHGLRMDKKRRSMLNENSLKDRIRSCELAAYVADCDLLPIHKQITLRVAMIMCFNLKNFKRAAYFAEKLLKTLELTPKRDLVIITQIVYDLCKENLIDEHEINYKDKPFTVCSLTYQPIYDRDNQIECPFCGSCYIRKPVENRVCVVCELSEIGRKVSGLSLKRR